MSFSTTQSRKRFDLSGTLGAFGGNPALLQTRLDYLTESPGLELSVSDSQVQAIGAALVLTH